MAIMIPNTPDDFNNSYGEKEIFKALSKLSCEYTIFHSLAWNDNYNNDIRWGEADFLIFNPNYGILIIEVKSGKIEFKNGDWKQTRMDNGETFNMKDPVSQANKSKYFIIDKLATIMSSNNCPVEIAVWFPSVDLSQLDCDLPVNCNNNFVLDIESLNNVEQALEKIYQFYGMERKCYMHPTECNDLIKMLCPTFQLIPSLKSNIKEVESSFIRLTHEQSLLLDYIEEQKVASIQGGAGTGKTLLALEKANRVSKEGKTLFLCFNNLLAKYLKEINDNDNIDIYTIHKLTCKLLNIMKADNDDIIRMLNKYDNFNFNYKNIIIDEGQDFQVDIIDLLYNISKMNDGYFYVFYDKSQMIQNFNISSWINNAECRLLLSYNCRNTKYISDTSTKLVDVHYRDRLNFICGLKPNIYFERNKETCQNKIKECVEYYLSKGMSLNDITVLTMKSINDSSLKDLDFIGHYPLSQDLTIEKINYTTVRKFKGLESKVVILIDVTDEIFFKEEYSKLFYVGTSRATQFLNIIFDNANTDYNKIKNQLDPKNRLNPQKIISDYLKCR